jgi:hypothetical protein
LCRSSSLLCPRLSTTSSVKSPSMSSMQ